MRVNRCVCRKKVDLYCEPEGFNVECMRCGQTTPYFNHPEEAIAEWNREKDILDMIQED